MRDEPVGLLCTSSKGPYKACIPNRASVIRRGIANPESADITVLLIKTWFALLTDSPIVPWYGYKRPRIITRFYNRIMREPIGDTISWLSGLGDAIMKSCDGITEDTLTGTYIPEMRDTPVFKEYLHWRDTGDPEVLKWLLSFLYFGKKLDYHDENLYASALRAWQEVEDGLVDLHLPNNTVDALRKIVQLMFDHDETSIFDDTSLLEGTCSGSWNDVQIHFVRNGPKYVAEGVRRPSQKALLMGYHHLIDYIFFKKRLTAFLDEDADQYMRWILPDPTAWSTARNNNCRASDSVSTSKLRFVPKTYKKARSICMEPAVVMYFQQGFRSYLEELMRKSVFGRFVTLNDQERNQLLCLYGAATGQVDTIDLSAASDSVSKDLVKGIFPSHIAKYLMATRTGKVELPDGSVVKVRKFAPMGSALCFPTQCITFSAVVMLGYMLYVCHREGLPYDHFFSSYKNFRAFLEVHVAEEEGHPSIFDSDHVVMLEPFSVYGDDIICDTRVTDIVINLLRSLGFSVNTEKSFTGSDAFRESCGVYSWKGEDVTPTLFRVKHYDMTWNPESVASGYAMINHLGDAGYREAQSAVLRALMYGDIEGIYRKRKNPLLFSCDRDAGNAIFSVSPKNTHLERRSWTGEDTIPEDASEEWWRENTHIALQREEVRAIDIQASKIIKIRKPSDQFERMSHVQWWRAAGKRSVEQSLPFLEGDRLSESSGLKVVRRWTPTTEE